MTAPNVQLGSAQAVLLVAGREVITRLRSKAFRISTTVTLLLLIGFAVVMKLVSGGVDATVGFTGPATSFQHPFEASAKAIGVSVETKTVPDENAGRAQVAGGDLDALLVGDGRTIRVVVKKKLDDKKKVNGSKTANTLPKADPPAEFKDGKPVFGTKPTPLTGESRSLFDTAPDQADAVEQPAEDEETTAPPQHPSASASSYPD
jgi:hypothetical protein